MLKKIFTLLLLLTGLTPLLVAQTGTQCPPGQSIFRLELDTDGYFYEVSWQVGTADESVVYGQGTPANDLSAVYEYCVPDNTCLRFRIADSYGDGIAPDGVYRIYLNGVLIRESIGENYGFSQTTTFNCPPGTTCTSTLDVTEGTWSTLDGGGESWYKFVPTQNGTYALSTCFNTNTCPTKIWVYEACGGLVSENNLGTLFYNEGGCTGGNLAEATLFLAANTPYYIRLRYATPGVSCGGEPIDFSLSYVGPIVGCTDPLACNYQPLATVSDTCIYPGDPDCPNAPDLVVLEDVLRNSLSLGFQANADGCAVDEGCYRGFGPRVVLDFTTHIKNIGEEDYFIGQTPDNINTPSDQFVWDPCHQHWHYRGYAEYVLYDAQGNQVPIGSKNGFCVLDLECSDGGQGKYTCGNMGISAQCGDIYGAGLPCQWIDITDLPPGLYTFVVRVNWDQTPDNAGRIEKTYENNWAQACFNLTYQPDGTPNVEFENNCPTYVDCLGVTFGNAQSDCEGVCGGTALIGDWNQNTLREAADVSAYLTAALTDTSNVTTCRDLYADGHFDVYDAALLQECNLHGDEPQHWGSRFPCQFPTGVDNPKDIVYFLTSAVDTVARTFDIALVNPYNRVLGYEIEIAGITIDSLEDLSETFEPVLLHHGNRIIALAETAHPISKNILPAPVLRVHYGQLTGLDVCLDSVIAVVNDKYQRSTALLSDDNCLTITTSSTTDPTTAFGVLAMPNPASGDVELFFANPAALPTEVLLVDVHGRMIRQFANVRGEAVTFERGALAAGVYQFVVRNERGTAVGHLVWQ
jgi:hypothetical protein